MITSTSYLIQSTVEEPGQVRAWGETIYLPTYEAGEEEKNPMFLEKRVYQGSSGVVYPYPVVESISNEKKEKAYQAVFIENLYIKMMILPELGGRIQMAYDKVKNRHFVYYNQVIKPALVGLTGPWISGGIEFNWPQHHRPSTFKPTDFKIEEYADGSITVWCNEVERMFRMKGMQGFTLYPNKAYIEIKVKVYNRTPFPQTFLWWANPAVKVNDKYKTVFPPDVHAVFDHGKREVSNFPISTGEYYKQDYSSGVDISKYKNIPVPSSLMAITSKYDFVGGYEDDVAGGLLHVANHHISPGKKLWTWGNGDFGEAWCRSLTDEDGPYIELMTGVYTDNQPDFAWLQPYEEKSWVQYFLPYSEVGYVKNASKDIMINVELKDKGKADLILYTTSEYKNLRLELKDVNEKILFETRITSSPVKPFLITVEIGEVMPEELIFTVYEENGNKLISYQASVPKIEPIPDAAEAAKDPKDIASIEQLFLTGHHLEQYRHATYNPLDYYNEALNREPSDIRCNNAVGLLLMRRGQFLKAETFFRKAIETQTNRNPNPYDGEPYYNLGWSLKMQGKYDDAYSQFYKSTWNAAWQDSGYMGVAQIDCINNKWELALEHIDRSLIKNWHNHKARQLKTSILRKLGKKEKALSLIEESIQIDGFNMGVRFEKYLLTEDKAVLDEMKNLMRDWEHSYLEYALDFAAAGMYDEAIKLLENVLNVKYPIIAYALGYFMSQKGNKEKALEYYRIAEGISPEKCFPNRIEEVNILKDAMKMNPSDAKAPYYLGNFWYGFRQYDEAIDCWEISARLDSSFPTVFRNLSLAYYNKRNDKKSAQELLEKAFELDKSDARVFMELDQLYKKLNIDPRKRLSILKEYPQLVEQRDDLYIELVTLYNLIGEYKIANDLLMNRIFHPWEGGEGKTTGQYTYAHVELAKNAIKEKRYEDALVLLEQTENYPDNLAEGKLAHAEENDVYYYKGIAYRGLGDEKEAIKHFMKATEGVQEPVQAFFYNDLQPDRIFYQGLAWRALGQEKKALGRFNKLVDHGEYYLFKKSRINYFAVSLPEMVIWDDDLDLRNKIHCYYVMALGHSGLNNEEKANEYYKKVKELDVNKLVFRK